MTHEPTSADALAEEEAIQARQNERTTVSSMIKDREKWLAGCERTIELLTPEWERFEAREGHDLYTARLYADHVSEARKHRAELLLLKSLDPLHTSALAAGYASVPDWVAAMVGEIRDLARDLAEYPCKTAGPEDMEPGCCGPCRARATLTKGQPDA